jgi:hypothetical protein
MCNQVGFTHFNKKLRKLKMTFISLKRKH